MDETVGWTIWLTGLPASGKTLLARILQRTLRAEEVESIVLDSDEVRHMFTPTATYSETERGCFYKQLVALAALLNRQGVNVIIAATGNRRSYRQHARTQLARFAEVWIRCPLALCRTRDPKGLYAEAAQATSSHLPGVGVPYEESEALDVIVDSDQHCPEELAAQICATIPFLPTCTTACAEYWRYPW